MRSRPAVLACLLAATAAAQTPSTLPWNIAHRGALVFERKTERWQLSPPASRVRVDWITKDAERGGHEWRWFACALDKPPAGFEQPQFDDSSWGTGRGEFGNPVAGNTRTLWNTGTIVLRSKIDCGRKKPKAVVLRASHDDGIRVWVNGKVVLENGGVARNASYVLAGDAAATFVPGDNVIAVQCNNTGGPGYVDLAVALVPSLPPGVKTGEEVQKILAADQQAAAQVGRDLFGEYRPPALLLQGELDSDQQRIAQPPGDLREIGWWVAMDLERGATGGALNLDAPRLYRLGDLQIRGKVTAIDASGWQDVDVTVKSTAELELGADSKRFVQMFVRPSVIYGFDGRLRVHRRLVIADGKARVAEARTELTGRLLRGRDFKEQAADLELIETWKQTAEHKNQDSSFRARVALALKSGTAHLRAELADPNAQLLHEQPKDGGDSYNSGRLALGLLALIKGGVPKDDEVLQRALQTLRKRPLIDTYSLGNALMAMEAFYSPDDEWKHLQQGAIDRPGKRELPAADKELVAQWTKQLLNNIDTRVDPAYLVRFNYTRGERYDHSVNQYGLLGLYSAHLCGIEIPTQVWEAAANHLIAAQVEPGARYDLDLVDYRTLSRLQNDPDYKRTTARTVVRPAGWNYGDPKDGGEVAPVWGSMTCAGITGLAICQAALLDKGGKKNKLQGDATAARNAGFAWLAQHMHVRCHPGLIARQQQWFYYYLYGLERAALLSGIALLQDHDWYFEGALVLVGAQRPDGGWPAELHWDQQIERDAMAILFLKQSTLPVLTGQ